MFKVSELLNATNGKLISGNKGAVVKGISIDSRTIKPGEAFIALKGNNFDGNDFIKQAISKGARAVIAHSSKLMAHSSKGISFIQVNDTTKALGDIARFHRQRFDIPVIAVTGSNGKTTTKEMISRVLSLKFKVLKNEGTKNNQIGLPMALLNLGRYHDIAVLEIGTNHFGEAGYLAGIARPNIGVITNIGPSHLEYFRNLRGVFKEKYTLMKHLQAPYLGILNYDDKLLGKQVIKKAKKPFIIGFSKKQRSDFSASKIRALGNKIGFLANKKYKFTLNTLGYYNVDNALAAISVGRLFGMEYKDIAAGLSGFDFPASRLNLIKFNKARFIDDTYNSNPLSLKQALDALDSIKTKGRKIFVMGDMLELGASADASHRLAGKQAAGICDVFIAVGKLSRISAQAALVYGFDRNNLFTCDSSLEAREIVFKNVSLKPEDIILVKGSRSMKMEELFKA